jgi:hypothetical protein
VAGGRAPEQVPEPVLEEPEPAGGPVRYEAAFDDGAAPPGYRWKVAPPEPLSSAEQTARETYRVERERLERDQARERELWREDPSQGGRFRHV